MKSEIYLLDKKIDEIIKKVKKKPKNSGTWKRYENFLK